MRKLNATGRRWANQLGDFNLILYYEPEKINIETDYFSRFHKDTSKHTSITSQVDINKLMDSENEPQEDMSIWLCSVNSINSSSLKNNSRTRMSP